MVAPERFLEQAVWPGRRGATGTFFAFYCPALLSRFPMPPSLPAAADPTRIHLLSTVEVNYWCHVLNCTETRLRNAVLAVGALTADVRAYLWR